jgi:hypothetical protein
MLKCGLREAKCINSPFKIKCVCDFGYSGDGETYCDECGLTFAEPNLKIVGGIEAVPNSWPATAIVSFTYKTRVNVNGNVYEHRTGAKCGGTLIDRDTILTAAHCIVTEFTVKISDNIKRTYEVTPNEFYPSFAVNSNTIVHRQ